MHLLLFLNTNNHPDVGHLSSSLNPPEPEAFKNPLLCSEGQYSKVYDACATCFQSNFTGIYISLIYIEQGLRGVIFYSESCVLLIKRVLQTFVFLN